MLDVLDYVARTFYVSTKKISYAHEKKCNMPFCGPISIKISAQRYFYAS